MSRVPLIVKPEAYKEVLNVVGTEVSPALSPKNNAGLLAPCRPSWGHENPKPDQAKIITTGFGCRYPTDTGR